MSELTQTGHNRLPLLRRKDIILAAVLVAASLILLLPSLSQKSSSLYAVIYCRGEKYKTIDLTSVKDSYTLSVTGTSEVLLRVENGSIAFESSQCPDKLCVKSGKLRYKGQSAACLPAEVMISVRSDSEGGADVISY
ncbi:MAG: NusG domain II-containing protein [Clostridiales bacterium]|nr:NusG domain II-containing protein [Clostridiales bacterium]